MIRWPWVARSAYEAVCRERDRLVEMNGRLVEHTIRMGRLEHGVAEQPRAVRPPMEPMPFTLREYIEKWRNPGIRREMRRRAERRHAQGESWKDIETDFRREDEPQEATT